MEIDLDFLTLVARMRFFQGQYFRSRSKWSLDQAKKYEALVDHKLNVYSDQLSIYEPDQYKKLITVTIKSKA